jgi:hypothetical protein
MPTVWTSKVRSQSPGRSQSKFLLVLHSCCCWEIQWVDCPIGLWSQRLAMRCGAQNVQANLEETCGKDRWCRGASLLSRLVGRYANDLDASLLVVHHNASSCRNQKPISQQVKSSCAASWNKVYQCVKQVVKDFRPYNLIKDLLDEAMDHDVCILFSLWVN